MARVPDWQSGGHRFESGILHHGTTPYGVVFAANAADKLKPKRLLKKVVE